MNIGKKQIEKAMKKMGVSQIPLDAKRVVIELEDGQLVIDEPSVTKVTMQGQETYQVAGEAREVSGEEDEVDDNEEINKEDIKMVMDKTRAKENKVREVLEKNNGDIASSILELSG